MTRRGFLAAVLLMAAAHVGAEDAETPIGVVYHVNLDLAQATRTLRMVNNHLKADPGARIVVVAQGDALDFLLREAVDAGNYPYELLVTPLMERGVAFRACRNTLDARMIAPAQLLEGVEVVPAGVAEAARLQVRDGYAYIKP